MLLTKTLSNNHNLITIENLFIKQYKQRPPKQILYNLFNNHSAQNQAKICAALLRHKLNSNEPNSITAIHFDFDLTLTNVHLNSLNKNISQTISLPIVFLLNALTEYNIKFDIVSNQNKEIIKQTLSACNALSVKESQIFAENSFTSTKQASSTQNKQTALLAMQKNELYIDDSPEIDMLTTQNPTIFRQCFTLFPPDFKPGNLLLKDIFKQILSPKHLYLKPKSIPTLSTRQIEPTFLIRRKERANTV